MKIFCPKSCKISEATCIAQNQTWNQFIYKCYILRQVFFYFWDSKFSFFVDTKKSAAAAFATNKLMVLQENLLSRAKIRNRHGQQIGRDERKQKKEDPGPALCRHLGKFYIFVK